MGIQYRPHGFIAAWRARFEPARPGVVCQIGAGGVGRAVAFGLAELGAEAIRLVDLDRARAERLAAALREARSGIEVAAFASLDEAVTGANGIVNCSPIGMVGHDGTPVPRGLMRGAAWAFDAVYTPVDTRFLADAAASGLETLTGYELFFEQGLDCTEIFLGGRSIAPASGGPSPSPAERPHQFRPVLCPVVESLATGAFRGPRESVRRSIQALESLPPA